MTELHDRDLWDELDAAFPVEEPQAPSNTRRRWILAGVLVGTLLVAIVALIAMGPFADAAGGCGGG